MLMEKDVIAPIIVGHDEMGCTLVIALDNVFVPSKEYHRQPAHYLKKILVDGLGWYMTDEEFLSLMQSCGYKVRGDRIRCRVKRFKEIPDFLHGLGK